MNEPILGIISDSGYILYDDTPGEAGQSRGGQRLNEIDYDEFTLRLGPHRRREEISFIPDQDILSDVAGLLGAVRG